MLNPRFVIVLGLGMALSVFSNLAVAQESSAVVAEVGNQKLTAGELQEKEAGKLLTARYKYYLAERDALNLLIDQQVLEMQAAKESITVDELIKRHVTVTAKDPTEDQLKFYYEGLNSDEPYDAVRSKILDAVHEMRMTKAKADYVTSLRDQFGVIVELGQPSAQVDTTDAYRLGPKDAPVQLIEFADFECPYCQKVHVELRRLRDQFGDKVALVYKDFPLPMHGSAQKAAEAARCAGAQGKFWEFHDALFESHKLQIADLKEEARTLKLDGTRFDQCLDSGEQTAAVKKDLEQAKHLGLSGTPAFFANGQFLSGAVAYSKLREVVEEQLGLPSTAKQSVAASSTMNNTVQK
ncbi:MAG: thioredoxin domain-containing protein [Terriglobales bacterium]